MPEVTDIVTIRTNLTTADLAKIVLLIVNADRGNNISLYDGAITVLKTSNGVQIQSNQEVTLEFDMTDYI